MAGAAAYGRAIAERHRRDSPSEPATRHPSLRRCQRVAGVGPGGRRRRDREACGSDRRSIRRGARRAVLEQPDLSRGDDRKLSSRSQHNFEFRSLERRAKTRREIASWREAAPRQRTPQIDSAILRSRAGTSVLEGVVLPEFFLVLMEPEYNPTRIRRPRGGSPQSIERISNRAT